MSRRHLASVLLTLCAAGGGLDPAAAQSTLDPRLPLRKYVIDTWGTDDGLPNTTIEAALQTRDGYIWLGTRGGLARFDGVDFKVFDQATVPGFQSNRVVELHEDRRGTLWVGLLQGGLHRLRDGRWEHFDTRDGLRHNSVTAIYEDEDGELWIGHHRGVERLVQEGGGLRFAPVDGCPDGVHEIVHTGEDVWVLGNRELQTMRGGACREPAIEALRLPKGNRAAYWTGMLAARDGSLWLGTADGKILRLEDERLEVMTVLDHADRRDNRVPAFYQDRAGTIWAGSYSGLVRFAGGKVDVFGEADGLADRRPLAFFEDHEGSFWIGTYTGLQRFKSSRFEILGAADGLSSDVAFTILEDAAGVVWIGTETGVDRYDDGKISAVPMVGDVKGNVLAFLEDSLGRLWVGTSTGLFTLESGVLQRYGKDDAVARADVRALLETHDGTIWVGTHLSALRLEAGVVAEELPLDGWAVTDFHEDRRGDLWISTEQHLFRRRGKDLEAFPPLTDARTYFIREIREDDDGVFWLSTVDSGLLHFDESREEGRFTQFTTADGLYDDHVWYSVEDDNGTVWMCSDRGIFTAQAEELDEMLRGERTSISSVSYGLADGLKNLECNGIGTPSGLRREDGTIWFVTAGGVVVVDPDNLDRNPIAPNVFVGDVDIDGWTVNVAGLEAGEALEIPHDARQVEFRFTATSFRDPSRVRFRYRLEDYDPDWISATGRRWAVYGSLPPGNYRFRVKAANNDGLWNEDGAVLPIVVPTPVWRTWWAIALYLLAGVLSALGWNRAQRAELARERAVNERLREFDRNLRRRNAELARFNYTLSHDLKNELTTITNFLGLARKDARQGLLERLEGDFDRLDGASRKLQHLIDDLLKLTSVGIELHPVEEVPFGDLVAEARARLVRLIEQRGARVAVADDLPMVDGDRQQLVEVVRELIENAVRHGGEAPRVDVGVREDGTFYVRDDGPGIDPLYHDKVFGFFERLNVADTEGTGIGLPLVRRIVEFHGGRIWVESEGQGKGAAFCFTLPSSGRPPTRPASPPPVRR